MKLDITIHKGNPDKLVVIFIHGLGVDKNMIVNPLGAKIFGNNVPLKYFASRRPMPCSLKSYRQMTIGILPRKFDNLWTVLKGHDFNLVCWSQRRPVGPISAGVEELAPIMTAVKEIFPGNHIALIGHSRGGLIARKFMEKKPSGIKALITISTPHQGSSLAIFRKYLKPFSSALKVGLPENAQGAVSAVLKRLYELIEGEATKELLPGSDFLKNLRDSPDAGISYLSFGGTKTHLLTVYKYKKRDNKLYPEPFLTIPDSLLKVFPRSVLPEELIPGQGDFLVSSKSSLLPWASEHSNVPANHISVLWNKTVINKTVELLKKTGL